MIHLIWHGKGWVVPSSLFGCSLLSEILTRTITDNDDYYGEHGFPIAVAFFVASLILTFVYLKSIIHVKDEEDRIIETLKPTWIQDSFFFISIQAWAIITPIIAIIFIVSRGF